MSPRYISVMHECPKALQCVRLFVTPWTVAHQAPLSMGFSRQEYYSGLPFSPPGDLPHPGIEPVSLVSPALAGGFFTTSTTWEDPYFHQWGSTTSRRWGTHVVRADPETVSESQNTLPIVPRGIHCELCIKQHAQQCSSVCRGSVGVSVKQKDDLMTRRANDWINTLQGE